MRFSRTKPKPFVPDQIMRDWIKGVKEDDDDDDGDDEEGRTTPFALKNSPFWPLILNYAGEFIR